MGSRSIPREQREEGRRADHHSGDQEADAKRESKVGSLVYGRHMPELREVAEPIQSTLDTSNRWDGVRYAYNRYILIHRENMEIGNQARQQ